MLNIVFSISWCCTFVAFVASWCQRWWCHGNLERLLTIVCHQGGDDDNDNAVVDGDGVDCNDNDDDRDSDCDLVFLASLFWKLTFAFHFLHLFSCNLHILKDLGILQMN